MLNIYFPAPSADDPPRWFAAGCPCDGGGGSGGRLRQVPDAHQVVRGGREPEDPPDPGSAAVAQLAKQPDRLHPAEDYFDALANPLADGTTQRHILLWTGVIAYNTLSYTVMPSRYL